LRRGRAEAESQAEALQPLERFCEALVGDGEEIRKNPSPFSPKPTPGVTQTAASSRTFRQKSTDFMPDGTGAQT